MCAAQSASRPRRAVAQKSYQGLASDDEDEDAGVDDEDVEEEEEEEEEEREEGRRGSRGARAAR